MVEIKPTTSRFTASLPPTITCTNCSFTYYDAGAPHLCKEWAKDGPAQIVQCSTCPNHEVLGGEITEQAMIDDGWLLGETVYCPKHGPDDDGKGGRR